MRKPIEFEVRGVQYRADPMPARVQFHVSRRLTTPLSGLVDALSQGKREEAALAAGLLDAFGSLPDDVCDYVFDQCLETVSRRDGKTWHPMRRGGVDMFEVSMADLCLVTWHVLKGNLAGFFSALPPELQERLRRASSGFPFPTGKTGSTDQPSGE